MAVGAARPRVGPLQLTAVRHTAVALVGLFGLYVVSGLLDPYRDLQLAQAGYLVCAAAGLTLLTGLSGQISLGQGAFMAVGAYTAALLTNDRHWPLPAVLLAAVAVTAALGAAVGAAAARLRGPYLAGATLALAVGLPSLTNYRPLTGSLGGQNGLSVTQSAPPAGLGTDFPLERWQLWISGGCAILTLWMLANLAGGGFGRSLRAVRDDEVAAALAGIRVARVQVEAFVVAAGCAGLGGALLVFVTGLAAPGAFGPALSLQLITAVILGGLGSLAGAVYGSVLLVLIPSWAADLGGSTHVSHDVAANLPLAIYGLVLIVVMVAFPGGLQEAVGLLVPPTSRLGGRVPGLRSSRTSRRRP
jgi:branched-chain amino acid transport system permease protein